ncbi:MAG: M28 family peptidase [Phycisphaerales bacterium]
MNTILRSSLLLALLVLSACSSSTPASRSEPSPVGARSRPAEVTPTPAPPTTPTTAAADPASPKDSGPRPASLRNGPETTNAIGSGPEALERARALGPDAVTFYEHLAALTDPALEGRSPDVKGNEKAAAWIEDQFAGLGLKPAFFDAENRPSFRQPFKVRGEVEVKKSLASFRHVENIAQAEVVDPVRFEPGKDFNVLGSSATGEVIGPLAFVGYSMEDGPDGYATYAKDDALTGHIAIVLRFEPMDATGKSKWTTTGRWSQRAELASKIKAAASRGAGGVILVSPPGADDPRTEKLETARTTRFGGVNVPVVMMTIQAVNQMLAKADPEGRTLLRLRQMADEMGGIVRFPANTTVELSTEIETKQLATTNVGAVLPGRGVLANEYVVLGAHYDHVGLGYVGGAQAANLGQIHPGADDNASGTAGLIMAARTLAQRASRDASQPARSIMFLAFSAEEMGLLGSDHFIKNPIIPASSIQAMVNMDMIGRMSGDKLQIDGVGTAENFETFLKPTLDRATFTYTLGQSGRGPSDHASFYGADIPVLHFFSGLHPDYHTPTDTLDKVNLEGAIRIASLVSEVTEAMAAAPERLKFKSTGPAARGGRMQRSNVRLGIAPGDYSGSTPGVLVGEVFDGTSAGLAGIKKGDRLIKWSGEELPDVEAMMSNLAKHKPGDKVDLVIVREGQEMTVTVTLQGRNTGG